MTRNEINDLVRRYLLGCEQQDVGALVSYYAGDCTVESPIFGTIHGRTKLRATYAEFFAAVTNFTVTFNDIIIDHEHNERAVLVYSASWIQCGALSGIPATGGRFENVGAFVFTFREAVSPQKDASIRSERCPCRS